MIIHQLFMTLAGILCGSILFGSVLPRAIKNVDVTQLSNDHNPRTANAMKYAGVPVGIACLAGDLLKGALPVNLSIRMGLETGSMFPLIMAAPVFGHAYSLFHRGKGGKGIAVSFGVLAGLLPLYTELLGLLCVLYILNSTLIRINPHTRRTRVTFVVFSLGAAALAAVESISLQLCLGAILLSCIVIHKNSLKQQYRETAGTAFSDAEQAKLQFGGEDAEQAQV